MLMVRIRVMLKSLSDGGYPGYTEGNDYVHYKHGVYQNSNAKFVTGTRVKPGSNVVLQVR